MNGRTALIVTLLFSLSTRSLSFVLPLLHPTRRPTTLFGLAEWRRDAQQDEILLLPFAANEALVQGQSQSIIFKEGRFYDLFQDCIDDYHSMVGMVLMGDDGLLKEMPLCAIDDFAVQAGFRGKVTVQVTLLAVARAEIEDFTQMKPIMMATARELKDDPVHNDVSVASQLVTDIESTIHDLGLQERYDEAFRLALESDSQVNDATNDASSDEKSVAEITAASWAVFASVSDKAFLAKAIASTSLIDRLELGLKALLDEKYQASAISNGEGDVAFQ